MTNVPTFSQFPPAGGPPHPPPCGGTPTKRCIPSTKFLTSNSNFETTSNLQNFLFPYILLILWLENYLSPNIPKNRQKNYKTAQNVDTWDDEQRDLRYNHNTQPKYGLLILTQWFSPRREVHVQTIAFQHRQNSNFALYPPTHIIIHWQHSNILLKHSNLQQFTYNIHVRR